MKSLSQMYCSKFRAYINYKPFIKSGDSLQMTTLCLKFCEHLRINSVFWSTFLDCKWASCKAGTGGVSWINVCRMPTICATLRQEGASCWEQNWPTLVKTGLKGVCPWSVRVMDSISKGWEKGEECCVIYCCATNYTNLSGLTQTFIISHCFCGSGIWMELIWVVQAESLMRLLCRY